MRRAGPLRRARSANEERRNHARSRPLEKARILGFQSQARDNHEFPAAAVLMIPLAILLTVFGILAAELMMGVLHLKGGAGVSLSVP